MRNSKTHRQIYTKHYGKIPKDSDGRSFEIHHIDGNHENNDIENLIAVSLKEHYAIHYAQEDYYACWMISRKMKMSSEHISELAKLSARERVENKTHHLLRRSDGTSVSSDRVKDGTHNLLGDKNPTHKRIEDGTHNFLGDKNPSHERVENGTHHLLGGAVQKKQIAEGKHTSQFQWHCDVCGKSGKGKGNFTKHHGENCKQGKEKMTHKR